MGGMITAGSVVPVTAIVHAHIRSVALRLGLGTDFDALNIYSMEPTGEEISEDSRGQVTIMGTEQPPAVAMGGRILRRIWEIDIEGEHESLQLMNDLLRVLHGISSYVGCPLEKYVTADSAVKVSQEQRTFHMIEIQQASGPARVESGASRFQIQFSLLMQQAT